MISYYLSPIDYIFTGIGSQPITFAFFFDHILEPNMVRSSFFEALKYFPILHSRLKKISETDYEFQTIDDILLFSVQESQISFSGTNDILQFIHPVITIENELLTRASLTQTPKGSVVAVSISHALVDGFSYFHFLSSWVRICRGERFILPHILRDVLSAPTKEYFKKISSEDIYSDCGLFYGDERIFTHVTPQKIERVFISNEIIKSHIIKVKQEHNLQVTENDVITAILWKKYIPLWNQHDGNHPTYLTCPFDFRRVKKNFPKNYFGCALCFATVSLDMQDLIKNTIEEITTQIKNSINAIKDEFINQSLTTLESFRNQNYLSAFEKLNLRHSQDGMIITNLTRMPIQDFDFGSGAPQNFSAFVEITRSAAILAAANGVEVLVVHP